MGDLTMHELFFDRIGESNESSTGEGTMLQGHSLREKGTLIFFGFERQ